YPAGLSAAVWIWRPEDSSEIALVIAWSVEFRLLNALIADWLVLTTREDIRFLLGVCSLHPWSFSNAAGSGQNTTFYDDTESSTTAREHLRGNLGFPDDGP